MTQASAVPTANTSTSPTARHLWTRSRGLLLALTVLIVAGVILAALHSGEREDHLDPRSPARYGSRAVAQLLADRGVTTELVTTVGEAASAAGPNTTVLVTAPDRLLDHQQRALHDALTASGGRTVLIAPGDASVGGLAPGVQAAAPTRVTTRSPRCALSAARQAGTAELGGFRYRSTASGSDACYPSGGVPTLLRLRGTGGADTVLLGAPNILYNDRLDEQGNASLALQLLGSRPHLVWYLPSLADAPAADGRRDFFDLIPAGWKWALLQLAVAVTLAALWRARRLGPLVTERLPVVVPAAEATEGRARLYRQANARARAADALRSATRSRLAPLVGVPAAHAHNSQEICPAVARHLPDSGPDIQNLLFGQDPADDKALVRLADDLDGLERRVTSSHASAWDSASSPTEKDRTS